MYGSQPQATWKDVEDRVTELINSKPEGELALIYKMLHARGFRIATVGSQIATAKATCGSSS